MPDGTIRADAGKIASAVSVFRISGEKAADVSFPYVVAVAGTALPGGSAIEQALDRACGAAAVCAVRSSDRLIGLADFADQAHRFLEAEEARRNLSDGADWRTSPVSLAGRQRHWDLPCSR